MDVLVAGGSGFLGQHLCAELDERGHDVTALSRDPDPGALPDGVETARSMNPLEFKVVARAVDLYRHEGSVKLGLTLGDDWVLAGAYDDDGQLRAVAESDDSRFVAWAEDVYAEYRSRAERVRS
mgnify:CR=1 FL=1